MIDGLSHIPVIVSDPNKIKIILMKVLDAKKSMTAVIEPIQCQKSVFLYRCYLGGDDRG